METLFYICFVLCIIVKLSKSDAGVKPECIASINRRESLELPLIILEAEHFYRSNTNGRSYSRGPTFVRRIKLGAAVSTAEIIVDASGSNRQKVTFAYNGTHICCSAQLHLLTDTCWAGSSTGCYNKTYTCETICFRVTDYHEQHSVRLFQSDKASFDIGSWSEYDYAYLYTMPDKQISCYHSNGSYERWEDSLEPHPALEKITCPAGYRCRITTGKKMYSSPVTFYIGCERDEKQYGGCEGCTVLEYHSSPDGGSVRWVDMCKFCCTEDLCNTPDKCKGTECDLTSTPDPSANNSCNVATKQYFAVLCIMLLINFRSFFLGT